MERMRVAVEVEALEGLLWKKSEVGGVQAGPQQGREVAEAGSGSRSDRGGCACTQKYTV